MRLDDRRDLGEVVRVLEQRVRERLDQHLVDGRERLRVLDRQAVLALEVDRVDGAGADEDLDDLRGPRHRGVELEAQARVALEALEDRVGRRRVAEAERVHVGDRARRRARAPRAAACRPAPARGRAPRTRTPSCASGAPGPTRAGRPATARRCRGDRRTLRASTRRSAAGPGSGSMNRVMSSPRPSWPAPVSRTSRVAWASSPNPGPGVEPVVRARPRRRGAGRQASATASWPRDYVAESMFCSRTRRARPRRSFRLIYRNSGSPARRFRGACLRSPSTRVWRSRREVALDGVERLDAASGAGEDESALECSEQYRRLFVRCRRWISKLDVDVGD